MIDKQNSLPFRDYPLDITKSCESIHRVLPPTRVGGTAAAASSSPVNQSWQSSSFNPPSSHTPSTTRLLEKHKPSRLFVSCGDSSSSISNIYSTYQSFLDSTQHLLLCVVNSNTQLAFTPPLGSS